MEDKNRNNYKGKEEKKLTNIMVDISPTVSIIILNVSGLNAPIIRWGLTEWIIKQHPNMCCLQKPTLNIKIHINEK